MSNLKELYNKEITASLMKEYNYSSNMEVPRLEKIVIKKIKSNSNKSNYLLKQKIIYDLINLGYDKEKIVYYFDKNITDDSSAILKEYNKLFKKLSLKYSDDKLKCEIKNKLFQKGYSSYEIDKIINEKSN